MEARKKIQKNLKQFSGGAVLSIEDRFGSLVFTGWKYYRERSPQMFDFDPAIVAILIPILAVIGTFAMIITVIVVSGREKELKHKERLVAMEKGMEIPVEPLEVKRPAFKSLRAWGLVLLFLGIVVFFALWAQVEFKVSIWGLGPAAIGAALLLAAAKEQGEYKE
jgi:hypothetical protein